MKKYMLIPAKITIVICFSTVFGTQLIKASQDSWISLDPMPTARASFGVAVVDGKIYAIGGGTNGSYLAVNEMYDPQTNTWTTKTPRPTPRADLEANVVEDKIYLIGGSKFVDLFPFNSRCTVNEVYDPANDSWATKTEVPNSVFGYPSAVVGAKIYVMGGWSKLTYKLNQIYDTDTDTWSYGKNLTIDTFNAGVGMTTGNFAPEKIYIFGTHPQSNLAVNVTQIYDIKNDTWSLGTPLPTPRYGLEVAVINDEIYALGGKNQDTYYATNEKYTPAGYIPEIPDWSIVPVFVVLTILAVILYKKMKTE